MGLVERAWFPEQFNARMRFRLCSWADTPG
jgi:hypothetical protein